MKNTLLGGLTTDEFLENYWQKKPLLIRQGIPGFDGVISRDTLFALARDADVESRLVRRDGDDWEVIDGPQRASDLRGKRRPWTVLVQGVNLWSDAADALMRRFAFIPQTRLDDLMISYATDGGGVGPHVDDYDVFLLQGTGRRRWRIGQSPDRTLIEDAPLKVLRRFVADQEWVLDPGDMLYLPPDWAHEGVALGACMTYSIGFRAPGAQELASEFLAHLQERVSLTGRYCDPDLRAQGNSARIPNAMIDHAQTTLAQIRWQRGDVADFLGCYLTEPKQHVVFNPPSTPLGARAFRRLASALGLRLDRRSLLLFAGDAFFLNGERYGLNACDYAMIASLAEARRIDGSRLDAIGDDTRDMLYQWYLDGFVHANIT